MTDAKLAKIKPLYDKPKNVPDRNIIDYEVVCPDCDMFICYPTEYNAHENYHFCPRCGTKIYWQDLNYDEGEIPNELQKNN